MSLKLNYLILRKCEIWVTQKDWILDILHKIRTHRAESLEAAILALEEAYNIIPRRKITVMQELDYVCENLSCLLACLSERIENNNKLISPEDLEKLQTLHQLSTSPSVKDFLARLTKWSFYNKEGRDFSREMSKQYTTADNTLLTDVQLLDLVYPAMAEKRQIAIPADMKDNPISIKPYIPPINPEESLELINKKMDYLDPGLMEHLYLHMRPSYFSNSQEFVAPITMEMCWHLLDCVEDVYNKSCTENYLRKKIAKIEIYQMIFDSLTLNLSKFIHERKNDDLYLYIDKSSISLDEYQLIEQVERMEETLLTLQASNLDEFEVATQRQDEGIARRQKLLDEVLNANQGGTSC
jgi:hypothetical protein